MNENEGAVGNDDAADKEDKASFRISSSDGEHVHIGPGGLHVKDKDSEVRVSWSGIRVRDGKTDLNINVWKPAVGCAIAFICFAAVLTAVVMGIVRLMLP